MGAFLVERLCFGCLRIREYHIGTLRSRESHTIERVCEGDASTVCTAAALRAGTMTGGVIGNEGVVRLVVYAFDEFSNGGMGYGGG